MLRKVLPLGDVLNVHNLFEYFYDLNFLIYVLVPPAIYFGIKYERWDSIQFFFVPSDCLVTNTTH